MKKILTVVATAATAALILTGCSASMSTVTPDDGQEWSIDGRSASTAAVEVTLPDGGQVTCVVMAGADGRGGLSCDWDHVTSPS